MTGRRRLLGATLGLLAFATAEPVAVAQGVPGIAVAGYRSPDILGFALGMPLDAAVRQAQALAPPGSVTLPVLRRDPYLIVAVEAPAAFAVQASEATASPPKDNFYVMLNNAPRILREQPTRSSHVGFIKLVADEQRRLVRVLFEPAFVDWRDGLDAARRTPAELAGDLRGRFAVDVRLMPALAPGGAQARKARMGEPAKESGERKAPEAAVVRPVAAEGPQALGIAGGQLRVRTDVKSVLLTDMVRLPDDVATRLRLD